MSRRRRQGLSPTLFPFLAVLVCTLGTLILLLALVAENAATVAASEAEQARNADSEVTTSDRLTAENVNVLIEEASFRVQQLVAFRDAQVADIEDRRDRITHLDDHMRRLREELQRLNDEVKMVTDQHQLSSVDQQRLAALKSQIQLESERVAELQEDSGNKAPRFVIVPHKGPNGTDRRPVYLECTADGLKIWPEDIRIAETYLQDTMADANPLDAALRVIRHHAMQFYGDSVAPYPLLVVRPDGIKTYAAARRAMRDWDDQFGYELVPADVQLAYDAADPALKKKVDDVIRQAIIKQNGIQKLTARIAAAGGSPRVPRKYPTLSAAAMDRLGRASGFRDHRDGYTYQNPYAQAAAGGYSNQAGAGTGIDAASKLDQQLRDANDDLPVGELGEGQFDAGQGQFDGKGSDVVADSSQNWLAAQPTNGSPGIGGNKQTIDGKLSDQTNTGGTAEGPPSRLYSSIPAAGGQPTQTAETDLFTPEHFGNQHSGDQHSNDQHSNDQAGDAQAKANPYVTNHLQGQEHARSNGSRSVTDAAREQNATASTNLQPPANASGARPNPAATAGMTMPNDASSANMSAASTNPPQPPNAMPSTDLVRRQGTNWALPSSVAATRGTAIVRTIRVQCYPDRFVLRPPRGQGRLQIFEVVDGDVNRATLQLATAVRDRIVRWGAALPGGRWQPRLEVEIMPRGDRRFHQLKMLMSGSGVDVEGRPSR